MALSKTQILISGGGVAGLTAAAAFGGAGFDVVIVDPAPPVTRAEDAGADLRTTAFLQPARDFLEEVGLWDRFSAHATPLEVMRIVDTDDDATPRATREFSSADISDRPFGWNLPNWLLRREILAQIDTLPNVDFRPGVGFTGMLTRTREARVRLTDGSRIAAQLVVGADGRNSPVRAAAGIAAQVTRYGQKAVTFAVTHAEPHHNISTEVHRTGGPFTLVPLPDVEGLPCSAVVWMDQGPEIARLMSLDDTQFAKAATDRSGHVHGPLRLANRRTVWPIISQIADALTAERTALVAEAAHVVPPIGAQGLNMSLLDIKTLRDLALEHRDDPGGAAVLDAYALARLADVRLRVRGIDALNRASIAGLPLVRDLRSLGIKALHDAAPVRRQVMELGLGAKG